MTGAPVGWLVVAAVAATVLAALLSAGEAAVLRTGRSSWAAGHARDASSRVPALLADAGRTAAAATGLGVVLEAVAAICVTVTLAAVGLGWWQVLLLALLLLAASSLVVVRAVPRTVGRRFPEATLGATAGLLAVARAIGHPVRGLVPVAAEPIDDSQILEMLDRAERSEAIEADEGEMFRSVLELGDTITRAVMVPRTEMITLAAGTPLRKALGLFLKSGYSRVPVVGESVDDVLGVLYLKDVVRRMYTVGDQDEPADALLRRPVFVPESKPVDDLLHDMQAGASHMAMVVDEFGGIAGLVTVEDALEEIVGELTDEHDQAAPEVEDLGDGRYRVPSRMPLGELGELFGLEIDDDDVDSAGGLLAKALGKVPLAGSSAEVAGLRLTADRVEGRRKQVATVLAERVAQDEESDA
ncbi:hemolysin family protein [Actinotalea fermentans]|uniref:CBS domain-containing protein n=1 Tax=Actinotalea fermentans TaxID=43671 RepID=A0A511YTN5_9CELL|nr:hemolysin family protein [Actinotalea fermentans]KGM17206.1 membrane protein [Actinotalea fermentans ATCC 43279 = JCM 9966 = DSM 3133]GEN78554.1 hypothetical protein AFE02nite_02880 [Actinotalea fermentans]